MDTHLYLPLAVEKTPEGASAADAYLNEGEAAWLLRVSARTLQRGRKGNFGPPFVRVGERRLLYRLADLRAWAAAQSGGTRHAA